MAKISFTKLGLNKNIEPKVIEFNGQEIEVKQYLPVNEKLKVISRVINYSADENNFANPVKMSVFTTLEIMFEYTNINFTEKQKEDPAKLYDILTVSGLVKEIINVIPEAEYQELLKGISDSAEAVYKYKNSVMGVLEMVTTDYSNLNLEAQDIRDKLADPNNINLVKDILTKLG